MYNDYLTIQITYYNFEVIFLSQRVIDIDTYIFNLTEANEKGESIKPKYFELYNHKQDLEMKSVFPKDFDELANRMATNDTLYDKFFRYL